jgi:hypothetical protein
MDNADPPRAAFPAAARRFARKGCVSGLPRLSEQVRRRHTLRWAILRKEHGFTGEHLKWHESQQRRRRVAKPVFSLAPAPIDALPGHPRSSGSYPGEQGELISYDQWKREQLAAWAVRENDPRTIDTIGIGETVGLAQARFADLAGDYLCTWVDTNLDSDAFGAWLHDLATLVLREVGDAWRESEWHRLWFERVCQQNVEDALAQLIEKWTSRAVRLEIQALENPLLSRRSLLNAHGNVALAGELEREQQVMQDGAGERESDSREARRPLPMAQLAGKRKGLTSVAKVVGQRGGLARRMAGGRTAPVLAHGKVQADTAIADRAARRQAVVSPILSKKRWTPGRLVTEAGVGKATVYGYLNGTRASIAKDNYNAIADSLGLKPEELPK